MKHPFSKIKVSVFIKLCLLSSTGTCKNCCCCCCPCWPLWATTAVWFWPSGWVWGGWAACRVKVWVWPPCWMDTGFKREQHKAVNISEQLFGVFYIQIPVLHTKKQFSPVMPCSGLGQCKNVLNHIKPEAWAGSEYWLSTLGVTIDSAAPKWHTKGIQPKTTKTEAIRTTLDFSFQYFMLSCLIHPPLCDPEVIISALSWHMPQFLKCNLGGKWARREEGSPEEMWGYTRFMLQTTNTRRWNYLLTTKWVICSNHLSHEHGGGHHDSSARHWSGHKLRHQLLTCWKPGENKMEKRHKQVEMTSQSLFQEQ